MQQRYFFGVHNNKDVVRKSSSGGAFTAISDAWFEKYGDAAVVYGCVMGADLKAKHTRATDSVGRDLMRGSKYILSDMSGIYQKIAADINDGKYVLFSGTPCQVAAVKSYLSSKNIEAGEKFLTIDLICHGVADSRFFYDYIAWLERKYKSKAVACRFREKNRPGKLQAMGVVFENGRQYVSPATGVDWFYSAYHKNLIIRPACFMCKFASVERTSDITLGDYWRKNESSVLGESLIICNTEVGASCVEELGEKMPVSETDFDGVYQPQLCETTKKPDNYDLFNEIYAEKGFSEAQKYIGNNTFKGRVKYCFAYVLDKLNLVIVLKKLKSRLR